MSEKSLIYLNQLCLLFNGVFIYNLKIFLLGICVLKNISSLLEKPPWLVVNLQGEKQYGRKENWPEKRII